jgi:O-antigen ligase
MVIRIRKSSAFEAVLLGLFALNLFLSIAMTGWGIASIPVRTVVVFGILGLVAMFALPLVREALSRNWVVLLIICYLAALLALVSTIAGTDPGTTLRQIIELDVQAAVGLVVGYCLMRLCGPQALGVTFIAMIGVSLLFAVLQFLHIGIGWAVFDFFTRFETRAVSDDEFYDIHERAMGLSYSPVLLGEQLCLAFAVGLALLILRDGDLRMFRRLDWRVIAAAAALAFGCLVSGNRSPLLGLMVFMALYTLVVRPALGVAAIIVLLVALPMLQNFLDSAAETGLRIANTDNSSAEGRTVLTAYGLQLFASNPLGYGVAFDSTNYWQYYWSEFRDFENAGAIAQHALHNYYLMILNKTGIFSLVVVPFVGWIMWKRRYAAMLFVPYLVHANYHNDGPLQGDFLLWYILPIFSLLPTRRLAAVRRRTAVPRFAQGPVPAPSAVPVEG